MLHHGYHNTNTLISHNSANPRSEWIIQNMKVHTSYVEYEKPLKNSHCQLSSKKGPGMPLHKVDQLPHWKPPAKQCLGRGLRCVRCRWLLWPTAPIRPLCHYFLQLGRNGLRKQTFATVPKPHGMIPIFRSNVSDVLIEEPLHERHVVDFLRNTEWGSGTVSIYAQICFPVNCQHSCAYFAIYYIFQHIFHMFQILSTCSTCSTCFILYILTCLSVNVPHMYQICSLNLDHYVFFQFVYVT